MFLVRPQAQRPPLPQTPQPLLHVYGSSHPACRVRHSIRLRLSHGYRLLFAPVFLPTQSNRTQFPSTKPLPQPLLHVYGSSHPACRVRHSTRLRFRHGFRLLVAPVFLLSTQVP